MAIKQSDHDKFNQLFNKYIHLSFPTGQKYKDPNFMLVMFNELFDVFIQNDTLKQFYKKRARLDLIRNDTKSPPAPQLFELHSKHIFESDGELKSDSILKEIMKVFPLNIGINNKNNVLIDKNVLTNMIQNIYQTMPSDNNILLKNF
jgi:hypothetical protein